MSVEEPPNIPEVLKNKINDLLSRFFTKTYGDEVRNPVLLLNFLYQHSLLTKPGYDIRADPVKPFYFIGTCSLSPYNSEDNATACGEGPWKVEVEASSKKECKKRAAQKFLNLFLADEKMDVMNHCDNQECDIDLGIKCMSIENSDSKESTKDQDLYEHRTVPTAKIEKFYEDDFTGMYSFDTMDVGNSTALDPNGRNKSSITSSSESSILIVDPQCSADCMVQPAELNTGISSSQKKKSKKKKKKKKTEPVQSTSSASLVFPAKLEEQVVPKPKSVSLSPDISSPSDLSSSDRSISSISSSDDSRAASQNERALIGSDFFDPFSRLRPRIGFSSSRKGNAPNIVKENSNREGVANGDTIRKFPLELGSNNKTPFQILQEKAVKNFKLIPRSVIEKTEDGFSCTLVLDTNTGHGEGRTKKEAKLKAAISLLELLGNFE